MKPFVAISLVLLWAFGSGCAAPLQSGGVEMRPNAEARLEVMCRYRATDAPHVCAEPAEE